MFKIFKKQQKTKFSVPENLLIDRSVANYMNKIKKVQKDSIFAVLTIVSLVVVPLAGINLVSAASDTYTASLNEESSDGQTWVYDIEVDSGDPAAISHISLQFACLTSDLADAVVEISPNNGEVTNGDPSPPNPVTGDLIKWEPIPEDTKSYTVSVTLDQVYGTDPNGTTIYVKQGSNKDVITVPGPDCEPAPETANLTLVKEVTNDYGGTAEASDWTLSADGPTSFFGTTGSASVTNVEVDPGTYALSESGPSGYIASEWSCTDGTYNSATDEITLEEGSDAICTITNNDQDPKLTLVKHVDGDADPTEWTLYATPESNDVGATELSGAGGFGPSEVYADVAYTLSESEQLDNYTASGWTCDGGTLNGDTVTLSLGDDVTCEITNTYVPEPGSITVYKEVNNNYGGTAEPSDFTLYVDNTVVEHGVSNEFEAGTYIISEDTLSGYEQVSIHCGGVETDTVELDEGEHVDCTVVNDDEPGTLIVKKVVVNDNGGTMEAGDFSFSVNGDTAVSFTQVDAAHGENELTVDADTYTITEPAVNGYTTTYDNCTDVVIGNGETETCTITNDDNPGTLIVKKVVEGGELSENDFSFSVNDGSAVAFEEDGQNDLIVDAGTYTIVEDSAQYYDTTYDNCTDVVIGNGETETCTITNTYNPPEFTLEGYKFHDKDEDGVWEAGEEGLSGWTINLSGDESNSAITDGSGYYQFTVTAGGDYTLCEENQGDWSQTSPTGNDGCHVIENLSSNVTGLNFGNKEVVIEPNPASLTIQKQVEGDEVESWSFSYSGDLDNFSVNNVVTADTHNGLSAGSYTVTEDELPANWSFVGIECNTESYNIDGQSVTVELSEGDEVLCTFTNSYTEPEVQPDPTLLTLVKEVINDNGRSAVATNWTLTASGPVTISGTSGSDDVTDAEVEPGTYTLSESDGPTGYNFEGVTCSNEDSGGTVTLNEGDNVTCTFVNNDTGGGGGGGGVPSLSIEKTVTPTSTSPDTTVSYTIRIENLGGATAINVVLTDVLPEGFTYTETGTDTRSWNIGNISAGNFAERTYDVDVAADVTAGDYVNTATANASNHGSVSDTATVTIGTVLGEETEPVLEITKVGDKQVVNPGGQITYTVSVTNTGDGAALDMLVTDVLPEGFSLAEDGSTALTWTVPVLAVGDTWETSFLVNVSEDIAVPGDYVNEVTATAGNYGGTLFASYAVTSAGQVLGETGASATDIALWLVAVLVLAGIAIIAKRELALIKAEN